MLPAIPTALTPAEATLLRSCAAGRHVFEAGALLGFSTVVLAGAARSVVSADPHDGYPEYAPRPTWAAYRRNLTRFGVADRVRAHRGDFESASPAGAGFAWADLTGCEEITRRFLEHVDGVPLVAIHDYGRSGCDGATRAVDRWIRLRRPSVLRVDTTLLMEMR